MSEVHTQPRQFAGEEPVVAYRAVSRGAVAALLLGLASPLVLVSPILAVVPLAAALLAVVALRRIGASDGQLIGRAPALVGLALALFSLGAGFAWSLSRQARLEREAARFAEAWLAVIARGDLQAAHQLKLPKAQRSEDLSLDNYYQAEAEAAQDLQSLMTAQPLADFIALGQDAKYRCSRAVSRSHHASSDTLVLEGSFDRPRKGPQTFWITVTRSLAADGPPDWHVNGVSGSNPAE